MMPCRNCKSTLVVLLLFFYIIVCRKISTGIIHLQAVFEGNFLLKYASDTYLIIPAVNVDSRSTELSHITNWAKHNILKLNMAKSQEIIFVDRKRKEKSF